MARVSSVRAVETSHVAGTCGWNKEQRDLEAAWTGRAKECAVQGDLGNGRVLSLQRRRRRLGRTSSIAISVYNNLMCEYVQLWPEISGFAGNGMA